MNAKDELIEILKNKCKENKILCAIIINTNSGYILNKDFTFNAHTDDEIMLDNIQSILKVGYSKLDYDNFIESLNYKYDDGYGGQRLFGMVWFDNGAWLERGVYDGAEWWDYKKTPAISPNCL